MPAIPSWLTKILAPLLAVLALLGTPVLLHTPKADADPAVVAVKEATGGFMTGVCHPGTNYKALKGANIGWIRVDIPYPFNEDGSVSPYYKLWKKQMRAYKKHGIKVLAVTPYPGTFLEHGVDIRDDANIPYVQHVARYLMKNLRGIVNAYQITNEMGVDRFTLPFTMEEAAKFIGVQAEAMAAIKAPDEIIGYNLGGLGYVKLPPLMTEFNQYVDYVGIDIYLGCFEPVTKTIGEFMALLQYARKVSGKPVLLSEFGYISCGEVKTREEKDALLQERYGFENEAAARADIDTFISRLPDRLRNEIQRNYSDRSAEEKAELIFDGEYANHIYCELAEGTRLLGYPHTPDGQAQFYTDVLERLGKLDYLIGAFVYMWNDSEMCYVCGQPDCPVETGWGLVDGQGNKKPSYDAVRDGFAKLKTED
ncbi:MAG: hypothetical protein IJL52_09800 [Clostridia bacterium]|nr:hypothetical protein [Clostridia bacterium]